MGQLGTKGTGYLADVELRPAIGAPTVEALDAPADGWTGGTGPNELTAFINRLNHVRRESRALCHGDYRNVVITNRQLLFERCVGAADGAAGERVLVAVNADDAPFTFNDGCLQGSFDVLVSYEASSPTASAAPSATSPGTRPEHDGEQPASGADVRSEPDTGQHAAAAEDDAHPKPSANARLDLHGTLEIPPFGILYLRHA